MTNVSIRPESRSRTVTILLATDMPSSQPLTLHLLTGAIAAARGSNAGFCAAGMETSRAMPIPMRR